MPSRKNAEKTLPPADNSTDEQSSPGTGEQMTEVAGETLADEPSAVSEPEPGELRETIDSLGESIARAEGATGGYDLSESAHESAIERMEQLGDELVLETGALIAGARDFLLDVIKSRPKPWSASSQAEQRDVAAACEQLATGLVRQIVEAVRADGRDPVRVLLTKVTMGDDIQITGKLKPMSEEEEDLAVMALHHARGKHVLLTVASVDDYRAQHHEAETQPDERELPFESGDEPSDSDLSAEHLAPGGTDGDMGEAPHMRVNLQTGMVEELLDGFEDDPDAKWADVREATTEELAAERERVADFDPAAEEAATADA